jgi:hypothetical protein
VPGIEETRPVRSAYSARALVRSVVDEPGKLPALNIDSAGSNVELNPRLTSVTVFQSSIQLITRVKLPPNVKLCEPFSQLNESSIVQFHVLRSSGAFANAPHTALVRPKPRLTL